MEGKGRRAAEAAKTLLIILLSGSALWLILGGGLFTRPLNTVLERASDRGRRAAGASDAFPLLPQHLAVVSREGCCGVQYEPETISAMFQRLAPLLGETLSALDAPESITPAEWEQALTGAPAIYFDMQGACPLRVLAAWLTGREGDAPDVSARRLLLAPRGNGAALYYQDTRTRQYSVCRAQVTDLARLSAAAQAFPPNGAAFACQRPELTALTAETILSPQTPRPREFTASDPLAQNRQTRLEELLETLAFPVGITTIYDTPDGCRARSGNDMLTMTNGSTVSYRGTREEGRYPALSAEGESNMTAAVNAARRLTLDAVEPWLGQARLYLTDVRAAGKDSWQVEFGYQLDGVPVRIGQAGAAASVLVEQGFITQFDIHLRTYTETEQTTLLLPQPLAAAVLAAEEESRSLQLCFRESGQSARAEWIAE